MAQIATRRRMTGEVQPDRNLGRVTRAARVRQIGELDEQGCSDGEIAARLGLQLATVARYRADPDGSRQRQLRDQYRGTCPVCGTQTSPRNGPNGASRHCRRCSAENRQTWSLERIQDAVRDWVTETGHRPSAADWSPAHARPDLPGRELYLAWPGRWPNAATVVRRCGTFASAVDAALTTQHATRGRPDPAVRGARPAPT